MRVLLQRAAPVVVATLIACAPVRGAQAQGADYANQALNDILAIVINAPVYLSSRLPAVVAARRQSPGLELHSAKDFSIGLGVATDLYTGFNGMTFGARTTNLETVAPSLAPLPGLVFTGGLGLMDDLEMGAKVTFFPSINQRAGDFDIAAGFFGASLDVRYRFVKANGGVPEVLVSAGAGYGAGNVEIGREFSGPYQTDGAQGTFSLSGAPSIDWGLFNAQVDLRVRWRLSWFQPFIGLGVDINAGRVTSALRGNLTATLETEFGVESDRSTVELDKEIASEAPNTAALHGVIGFEFGTGNGFAFVIQADLIAPFNSKPAQQSADVEEFMTTSSGAPNTGFEYMKWRESGAPFRDLVPTTSLMFRYDFN